MTDPRISGYLSTSRRKESTLALDEIVRSLLRFCFEVVVSDGGDDEAWLDLVGLAASERRLRLVRLEEPAEHELLQAARTACRGGYCFEASPFVLVAEQDAARVPPACAALDAATPVLALPRVMLRGGTARARRDVPLSVPCLSLNSPQLCHDAAERACRYVDLTTGRGVACRETIPLELELIRQYASPAETADAFSRATTELPVIRDHELLDQAPVADDFDVTEINPAVLVPAPQLVPQLV